LARDEERRCLVARLRDHGHVRTARVEAAMLKVERHLFLPDEERPGAYQDTPLPIGFGQTISAPHMVAMMAELLRPKPGERVLEIGAGSGYHAAVIAELVRPGGKVTTVECIPELAAFARSNLAAAGYPEVRVVEGDGSGGYREGAPYDCILVAAAAPSIPEPLQEQLAEGGRMAIPVGGGFYQELLFVEKVNGRLRRRSEGGVAFVPLVGEHGVRG
jgi:protein-L-isoaspartate(D-aspartate) O-methyltransferase